MTDPNQITETVDITIRTNAETAEQVLGALEELVEDEDTDVPGIQQVNVTPSYVYIPPES
jgi:hypothetical protein